MKQVFFDFEFTGLDRYCDPISLGMVTEDSSFYAEFSDFSVNKCSGFVRENVLHKLTLYENHWTKINNNLEVRGPRQDIAYEIDVWFQSIVKDRKVREVNTEYITTTSIQMIGDVLSYDWMLFCHLFGGAMLIPAPVHYIPIDISTMMQDRKIDPDIDREILAWGRDELDIKHPIHNALYDARIIKQNYKRLKEFDNDPNYLDLFTEGGG